MLQSERLTYEKWTYDDFDSLVAILSDEEVCNYLPIDSSYSIDHIEKWMNHFIRNFGDEQGNHHFKVIETETKSIIGYAGLSYVKEFEQIEIMYGLNKSFWNKGYGTEVSLRMKELAISKNLKHLIAFADIRNIGSQKILLKTGFTKKKQIHLWGLDCYYYEQDL